MRPFREIHQLAWSYWFIPVSVILVLIALTAFSYSLAGTPVGDPRVKYTEVRAPSSPGLATALEACKLGKLSRMPLVNGLVSSWKYFAQFGLVTVEWPDSPPGANAIALVDGQPVVLSEEVQRCFRAARY